MTLYGDVVAPRGGEIWTGNIVETLATVGIGGSRVRTALSRLVAAARLAPGRPARRRARCSGAGPHRQRFGFPSRHLAVLPDRGAPLPQLPGCLFSATTRDANFRDLLADAWPLPALSERMQYFVDHFLPLEREDVPRAAALGLGLLLVHAYRELALRDPLLPPGLLPPNWPGQRTRTLFVRLYRTLSPMAEAIIVAFR